MVCGNYGFGPFYVLYGNLSFTHLEKLKKNEDDKTITIFQVYNSGLQQRPKTSKVIIPLSSAPFGELGYFVNCSFKIRHTNWKNEFKLFNEQHVK